MTNNNIVLPSLWLIILIAGLSQFSETVYTPSLPDIAASLNTSTSMVESTLTTYLIGFAVGTLFWGNLSDRLGRKPCVIYGLIIFIIACILCYASNDIIMLMIARFIQAFGASIGSVLGQAICRDAFHGAALGRVYSLIGSALALFPAIGPVIGGLIAEKFGWHYIFIILILFSLLLVICIKLFLPETHNISNRKSVKILEIASLLAKDQKVIFLGIIVAACNGIGFSYFAEGPFYLIKFLGLSPSEYGISFIAIAASIMLGGVVCNWLYKRHNPGEVMQYGVNIILCSTSVFSLIITMHTYLYNINNVWLIVTVIISQMITMFGVCIVTSSALAVALVDYKNNIGAASSVFGFFYYVLISLFTLLMSWLHNDSLLVMPIYFVSLALLMYMLCLKLRN